MKTIRQNFSMLLQSFLESIKANSFQEFITLSQELHEVVDERINNIYQTQSPDDLDCISADNIILGVIDKNSGKYFSRTLAIQYLENDNGLVLKGENSIGKPSEIVFLSEKGLKKINELIGKGATMPRCK